MVDRRWLQAGAVVWAAIGFLVAGLALTGMAGPAPVLVWVATIAFPASAVLAAAFLERGHVRVAGALLAASAATPTYFAWILNVPALLVGLALLLAPGVVIASEAAAGFRRDSVPSSGEGRSEQEAQPWAAGVSNPAPWD